ncbi:MAG: DUF2804 domain-containing protein [Erysipelotrichaceae bacterium]
MRNHEVTKKQRLLNDDGSINEPGFSKSMLQSYNRNDIKAPSFRIKEWDYYLVLCDDFAFAFTISDDGYIGLQSVSILDFNKPWEHTQTILNPFPMGKLKMPNSSNEGNCIYEDKRLQMKFVVNEGKRRIICNFEKFYEGKTFKCDITLQQPKMDTMVIATPWPDKKTAFYYNQKINCMRASGSAIFDGIEYIFNPETDFGTLDWGRGVWTYDNTWYWGSGNGIVDGKPFGFNIGYGFGDTSAASENMVFYDGIAHKLDDITFHIPKDSYESPWAFTSSDHRFEMNFNPIIDRKAKTSLGVIVTDQHQVFGRISGKVTLDNGKVLDINNLTCFAEWVHNRY